MATSLTSAQMVVKDLKPEVIGEFKQLGTLYAEIKCEGDECTFTYKDDQFKHITSYKSFKFNKEDMDVLYALFTNFEGVKPGDEKEVNTLDGARLQFVYSKALGKMYVEVYHLRSGTAGKLRWMTEKQARKLFGK